MSKGMDTKASPGCIQMELKQTLVFGSNRTTVTVKRTTLVWTGLLKSLTRDLPQSIFISDCRLAALPNSYVLATNLAAQQLQTMVRGLLKSLQLHKVVRVLFVT